MNLSYTPTLVYSVLGVLVLALDGMAFHERSVVVCALVAAFCVFVAEVHADRVRSYNEGEDLLPPTRFPATAT